jgi:hypothetical protein
MRSVLIAAALVALTATPMDGADCTVPAFKFFFGQRSSASITAGSGYTCHLYLNEKTGFAQSASVRALPRHGTVTVHGNDIAYRSAPGFTGSDEFTFRVVRGGKAATIEVSVSVKELDGTPLPPSGPIGLGEYVPWLARVRGPEQAMGAFYFIRGFVPRDRDDDRHHAAQYFLLSLSDAGWDVFNGKYPHDLAYPGNEGAHERVAEFVRNRVKELKDAGYRRVVLGGQSWGAWVTLVAAQQTDLAADALFLLVPATHGKRTTPEGKPNPAFKKNRSELVPLVASLSKPVAAIFFANDDFDPGGRGKIVEEHVRSHGLANVVIDNPPGFNGHGAAWSPLFDYVFGQCLQTFLVTLASQHCVRPAPSAGDIRSIVNRNQIESFDARRLVSPGSLLGHSYVVFSEESGTSQIGFMSAQLAERQGSKRKSEESYEFRDDQFCLEKHCQTLIRWDAARLIGFDPITGAATSWWIEN